MKKVVLLAPTPPPVGGIASWTLRMLKTRLPEGWNVEVVDEKIIDGRQFFGNNTKRNYFNELKRCIKIWRNLKKAIKKQTDHIVVHSCIPAAPRSIMREYVCALISKRYKRPFIIHFRCTVPNMMTNNLRVYLLKKICNISDRIIVLNNQSVDYLKKITNTPISLIPNFVNDEELVDNKCINYKVKNVVYVGGVIESKGCLDIIKIAKHFPNINFKLIGNYDDVVKNAAELQDNVILTGAMQKGSVRKELKQADIFMFLSYFDGEGFSNSLAEAMANGLPCIVTDWAANADMIENLGGYVIGIKNIEEGVNSLKNMMSYELRKSQSEFNISKVRKYYLESTITKKYVECYKSVL